MLYMQKKTIFGVKQPPPMDNELISKGTAGCLFNVVLVCDVEICGIYAKESETEWDFISHKCDFFFQCRNNASVTN